MALAGIRFRSLYIGVLMLGVNCVLGQPLVCAEALVSSNQCAVTTSWLECCLMDIAGTDVRAVRVCPPGTCPGHFDISPGAFAELQSCRLLFLFDFQKSIEARLGTLTGSHLELAPVKAPSGLCVPPLYLDGCRAVHDVLARIEPDKKDAFDAALERTRLRLADLERDVRGQMAKGAVGGIAVVSSKHQAEFCRWLGLKVVGTYSGGEAVSPASIESLVSDAKKTHVRYVVANLQEGRQFGEAVAQHLGARVITFSNFPNMTPEQSTFDALIRENLRQLMSVAHK